VANQNTIGKLRALYRIPSNLKFETSE